MPKAIVLAARQPEFAALLEDAGFEVEVRTRPLDGEPVGADVAVVFRGRLIGRNQAAILASNGVPVVEVLTGPATGASSSRWIRLSSRIAKPDLVQIVHALADHSASPGEARSSEAGLEEPRPKR